MLNQKWLIKLAQKIWETMWQLMMFNLAPSENGNYQRPLSIYHHNIEENSTYSPEKNRYTIYAGLSCPWAHRTLIVRKLKGLEKIIDVVIVSPSPADGGWIIPQGSENCYTLKQLYYKANNNYQGRCTVPVLWDKKTKTIVNNESSEIIVLLNNCFNQFASFPQLNLYPDEYKDNIDSWNEKIYHHINNGVYRCGFAQTQQAYEDACYGLFNLLDKIEIFLENSRYLCGDKLTIADIRLFTTLIRFDVVYFSLFKCNIKRIADYKNLSRYCQEIYNIEGVKETCNFDIIKQDYYGNLFPLNPGGIIPLGLPSY
ncbi:glutathione S-transferase C-terminal domain-containing protein [Cyanobacterium stanieri LEGE 03274]|uniref:Glutathione S-transferase C-terminal domain-containing protein n=1 Tax=Cyanobacterium stanieri LEGE 03274 TaxID=1828756 RepID=A0ABR9V304_9CHRO|nr:glutathione S-transferase C-terminal domain-containing protein [Cyanobacterium stanieri]MBE9222280.1 glutathione S-transferase C-terminal domain-containing protein [Cyanobacterium stanieri LEGE 03274]